MSKNLRKIVAMVLVLSVVISAFAMITAQGAEYSATITGWSSNISADYSWFANENITDAQKESTRKTIADELKFQNEVLEFRIGTADPNTDGSSGGTTWGMTTDWGNMAAVQIENKYPGISDNTGNPWGQESRWMGFVIAPFIDMAFTVKAQMAEHYPAMGQNPTLGNEFIDANGNTVQPFWKNYIITSGAEYKTVSMYPGLKGGRDVTNNMFRYAVAKYNQDNKRATRDGKSYHAGYPAAEVAVTADGSITYQTMIGERGTSMVAAASQTLKNGKLAGAYVIPDNVTESLLALADNVSDCFAITGAPVEAAKGGKQRFENGVVSSRGFQSSSAEITSFDVGSGIISDIDHEAGTVTAYVNGGTSLKSITPTIVHTGASIDPAADAAQDFSAPVKYTVKAECGDTKAYTVTVIELKDTDISSFNVAGVEATIDRETKTITALVGSDVDLTKVAPVIKTVGTGTTISPASGANVDLSKSWESGVKYTVTKGGDTSEYTVKVRNLSTDTTITKFNIPEGSLKYQTYYGEVVGKISGTNIELMYEYLNSTSSTVVADVVLAEGATISPDPTDARNQSNAKYTVTAEDGVTTATYTVKVVIDPDKKIGPKEINLETGDMGPFGGKHNTELAMAAIQAEYNNQRVNLGYDPGEVSSEALSAWDNVRPIRQFFDGGSSSQTMFGHTAAIMMDVPEGRAYTLKGRMIELWQGRGTTEDGTVIDWLFRQAGGAAINELKMNGATYQQFSKSYGKYGGGDGMTMNGIGVPYSRQIEALKDSYYYFQPDNTLAGTNKNMGDEHVEYSFRKAYEYANLLDHNPGIALDGNFNVIKLEGMTNEVVKETEILDSKGNHTWETTKKQWPNFVMYQVFSGSGPTDEVNRDAANKTVIIKGGNIDGVDHGGALALFGDVKTMYEAIPGDKQTLEFKDGNGKDSADGNPTGNVVDTVEYNVTLGTPYYYGISDEGEYVMEFARDTIAINEEGYEYMQTEYLYYTAPIDDPANVTMHEGSRLSGNNRIASVDIGVEGAEIIIMHNGELSLPDEFEEDDELAPRYENTAIAINYPAGYEIDLEKELVKFSSITLEDEKATLANPLVEEDFTNIPGIDCSASGRIDVKAENGSVRSYQIMIYIDGEPKDEFFPEWGSWWVPKKPELIWDPGYIGLDPETGKPVYGTDPNAAYKNEDGSVNLDAKDEDGNYCWGIEWGYYTNSEHTDDSWVVMTDVPRDWDPNDPVNGWLVYRVEHNLGVKVN